MNLSDILLPRELEAGGAAETVRQALGARTVRLWPGGCLSIPLIAMDEPVKKVIRTANLNGHLRWGLEAIAGRLTKEEKGIANLREGRGLPTGDRVSRLLLVSHDGAQRFYRDVERLLQFHAPRLLGCMVDTDGDSLGCLIAGKEKQIKIIMAEHKNAVADILRAVAKG